MYCLFATLPCAEHASAQVAAEDHLLPRDAARHEQVLTAGDMSGVCQPWLRMCLLASTLGLHWCDGVLPVSLVVVFTALALSLSLSVFVCPLQVLGPGAGVLCVSHRA